jgi:putative copper resistance protein D
MEHSALHATQLIGLLLALAAPLLALLVLLPARRVAALTSASGDLSDALLRRTARTAVWAALIGAVACFLNLLVQVAEFEGVTVFAGTSRDLLWRFASATTVGRLASLRGLLLLLAAVASWWLASAPARFRARAAWLPTLLLGLAAAAVWAMVSHAAAQPHGRALAIALHFLHLVGAASWVGVLGHLFLVRRLLATGGDAQEITLVAAIVARFSPLALLAATTLLATGAAGVWHYLGTPAALLGSSYGLTLTTKLSLLALLLGGGFVNYRIVRPALLRLAAAPALLGAHPEPELARATLQRLMRTIELEVTVGVLLVATAGILASVSPPTPQGEGRLDAAQIASIFTPRAPRTQIADPATWVGSASRTDDDLRYSEFMHAWSGVLVILLGLAWLVQSVGGDSRAARIAGWVWPAAFIPFAVFVAIASDPEVWPMGTVSPWVALTDPIVLEHRIGASMIVLLAVLGWREARRGGQNRPLGRALPVVMILGSLLLLGHAHSSFSASDRLTTIINVQHAILGGLGVLAGAIRWLEIKDLVPRRAASIVWPLLVLAIGLFMALGYRELA